ncbi:hypothetical protein AB0I97_13980 [Streptomyces sp. NPDC049951]|uniref:hypothetical protein n=1 Tax=Streptomyces sp. NPDC049951 TaxID=3156660 RepID=UPI00342E4353
MTARANAKISEDFVYNAVGDLTKTRGFTYTYDAAGQMLMRQAECGRMDDQRGPRATRVRRQASRSAARGPR